MRRISKNEAKYQKIGKKLLKRKNGITLIALVITIIVLLILASITIGAISGDNGILNNTGQAKEDTEISQETEIIQTAVVQAMGENSRGNLEKEEVEKILNREFEEAKVSEEGENLLVKIDTSNRTYLVDNEGSVRKVDWWRNSDENGNNYITNGEVTLQTGDYISYDANDNGECTYTSNSEKTGVTDEEQTFSSNYETTWRLLGVEHSNDADYLMLVPTLPVQSINSTGFALCSSTGYQYGIEELENICEIYGHGTGAYYARSMKIEDINKITGYDPMNTGDGTVFREGTIYEYGIDVEVTRTGYANNILKFSNGLESTYTYTAFKYFNEIREWTTVNIGETVNLTNTYYTYYPTTLTDSSTGEEKGISTNSREYSMIFSENKNYWLASSYELGGGTSEYISYAYGLFNVGNNYVKSCRDNYIIYVGATGSKKTKDVRPIVYLNKDIKLKETGNKVNECTEWEII